MKIADGVYLVGSGRLGISLTHPLDCNVYAVRCGEQYWLVDAGVGLGNLELPEEPIGGLLLTHYHLDHAGGAARLGFDVTAGEITAQVLEAGDEEAISLAAAKRAGLYPDDVVFHACPVARVVKDGEVWTIGDTTIRAIATPGHSRDMISYLIRQPGRTMLFPGDTLFHGGLISLQATHDCDPPTYAGSLRRLAGIEFDMMFPGHGLWSLSGAHRHIDAAMKFVDRLLLPPSL
jgi:glyoxylase-like metal-dependent hydrolase (beta-lactamase superfamily II)